MQVEYLFKTISVGSGSVGKTSLIKRFAEGTFRETYIPTLGVDFATKVVQIGEQTVKLVLFDTGGQELLGRLRPYYYRGANGALVCYDVTSKISYESLDNWISEIYLHVGQVPLILVGNKSDLTDQREVSREEAELYAEQKRLHYVETSAKTGVGVNEMFYSLSNMMLTESSAINEMSPPE